MGNNKRKSDGNTSSAKKQDTNARTKVGTPKHSMSNGFFQMKDQSEFFCRNGHPSLGQHLDLNKPEPKNLTIDINDFVREQDYDTLVSGAQAMIPPPVAAPPVAARPRRGRGGRNIKG